MDPGGTIKIGKLPQVKALKLRVKTSFKVNENQGVCVVVGGGQEGVILPLICSPLLISALASELKAPLVATTTVVQYP